MTFMHCRWTPRTTKSAFVTTSTGATRRGGGAQAMSWCFYALCFSTCLSDVTEEQTIIQGSLPPKEFRECVLTSFKISQLYFTALK